jgi:menaquinone-9 beta-reductase
MRYDVAVIGAGPAGATLATLLALSGRSVALIDRDEFPRDKVCGEFISWDAHPILEALGLAELLKRGAEIDRCRLFAGRRSLSFPLPSTARGLSRFVLDHALLERAGAAGATILTGWNVDEVGEGSNRVHCRNAGGEMILEADLIAGAWGRWGRLDHQLSRPFVTEREERWFGFKRHFAARKNDGAVDLFAVENGYVGVAPIEGELTNLAGLVHQKLLRRSAGQWEEVAAGLAGDHPELKDLIASTPHGPFLSSGPLIFSRRAPQQRGVLMAGDCATLVDPLTGSGVAMAIQSAVVLFDHLISRRLDTFRTSHEQMFGDRLRWSRMLARALRSPRLLSRLLTLPGAGALGSSLTRRTRATETEVYRLTQTTEEAVRNSQNRQF